MFMTLFSIVIYIITKYGNATKKHLTVAILVAVVVLWGISFLGVSPLFSQEVVRTQYWGSVYCYLETTADGSSYVFVGLYLFLFGVVTPSTAVVFLLLVCFNKHITSASAIEKTIVKFGFFLLFGNGLNMIGLLLPVLITSNGEFYVPNKNANPERLHLLMYIAFTTLNAGLIPTPILILIFFKAVRKRLLQWMCCFRAKNRRPKRKHKNTNGDGRMVTTAV